MKVRVTFDVTDQQRLGIGAATSGQFRPATREEIDAFIEVVVTDRLNDLAAVVQRQTDEIVAKIMTKLGTAGEEQ